MEDVKPTKINVILNSIKLEVQYIYEYRYIKFKFSSTRIEEDDIDVL